MHHNYYYYYFHMALEAMIREQMIDALKREKSISLDPVISTQEYLQTRNCVLNVEEM